MTEVVQISDIGLGLWAVHYNVYNPAYGCCGPMAKKRHTVIIHKKSKPTQKQINNAIKNQQG